VEQLRTIGEPPPELLEGGVLIEVPNDGEVCIGEARTNSIWSGVALTRKSTSTSKSTVLQSSRACFRSCRVGITVSDRRR